MQLKKHAYKLILAGCVILSSCGMPKDIVYFQNLDDSEVITIKNDQGLVAKPNDELSIVVNGRDPDLAAIFNLPLVTTMAGRGSKSQMNQQIATYLVDDSGDIVFPILGKLRVEGLDRGQISQLIRNELVNRQLLTDPVVTVNFVNVYFSVAGEVEVAGRYEIDRDHMTIIDALSRAGDLTIYGNRKGVKVLRREGDKQTTYLVDITDTKKLMESPAYIIQQDDVIYVAPNTARGRQSTVNGNNLVSYSFWLSLASVLTSMAVLIFK